VIGFPGLRINRKQVNEQSDNPAPADPVTADDYNSLGLLYAARQKHPEATRAFRKALALDSGCAEVFYNQALSLTAQGRLDEAIDSYTHAIRLKPGFAEAYYNLGNVLQRKGLIDKAIESYAIAVQLKSAFPEAHNNLGLCFKALKRFDQAVKNYQKAIELKPDYAEACNNLGLALQDQGFWDQAIEKFESAIRLKPDHSSAHYNLGFALHATGKIDAAARHYRRSILLSPDFADAHNNLGAILKTQGRIDEAICHYRKALEYSSNKAEIYNNLGNALRKSGRIDEALEMLQRAVAERPDYAEAFNNLGVAFQAQGNYTAALINYEKAVALEPEFAEVRFNRATIDLLLGNFSRGWQDYEARLKKKNRQDLYPFCHKLPRWDGSPFPGKRLYVHDEQGLGDTIQFVRYLPQVKALGGTVLMGAPKPLQTCLQSVDGIDEVVDRSTVGDSAAGCDLVIPLLSLAGIFGTDRENIPAQVPYVHAQTEKISYWKKRIRGSEFKIGLVWAGNPDHENDHIRSIALSDFLTLIDIPGLQLYGLQKGAAAGQVSEIPTDADLIDLGPELEDFSDTAAVMINMDLIISVDTATAHLAGALGIPVWTLIYFSPDWRWMLDRDDTPWYPTMRLFRQQKRDDWQTVIRQITCEVKRVVQNRQMVRKADPDADVETATRHYMAGSHNQAPAVSHRVSEAYPEHALTLHALGVAAHQKGDFENAKALIGQALSINSQTPLYHYNYGRVCAALGELQAAIDAYRRAIDLKPDYIEAYCSLGMVLESQRRFDQALNLFDNILLIRPQEAGIHHSRGKILNAQGQHDQAIEAFERAIELNPDNAKFYNSLGIARGLNDDQPAAIEAFEQALKKEPDLAEAVNNLGTAMQEQGEFDNALEYFNRALQIRPDYPEARFNRAAIHLLRGNFAQGWRDYEGRCQQADWQRRHRCPPGIPHWDGKSFTGKRLCVHGEQGLGDTLQFVRYLPLVKALGGTVVLETSELLVKLLAGSKMVDEFVTQGYRKSTETGHDVCVHLLSLPGLFQTTVETIPTTVPYVFADPIKVSCWKQKLTGPDFKVGIVWAGNPSHKRDRSRSVELERFAVLNKIPGLRLYGLQKGEAARQAGELAGAMDIQNFDDGLADFSDTAALIANLDLVISVDTAVAHLAGSMGKPIWVMLPYVPDWRWMLDRNDSPWYPTMQLFRQPEKGNWDAVMMNIAKELELLISSP